MSTSANHSDLAVAPVCARVALSFLQLPENRKIELRSFAESQLQCLAEYCESIPLLVKVDVDIPSTRSRRPADLMEVGRA